MAPPGDRYLPDLARCFAGEVAVFSWSETFRALSRRDRGVNLHLVNNLISSARVKTLLSQKIPRLSPPTSQSKEQFDSKTAAVNAAPSLGKHYDIDEIRNNAIWLSKEVGLAEDEALRITILEWQQQPADKLLAGYSDAELASLRDALGHQDTDTDYGPEPGFEKRNDDDLKSVASKRRSLIIVYFKEQAGLLGVSTVLHELALSENNDTSVPEKLKEFVQAMGYGKNNEIGVSDVVDDIESRLQMLENGKNWSLEIETINDVWVAWELRCVLLLHESMFIKVRTSTGPVATDTLVKWLQVMVGCDFFVNLQPTSLFLPFEVEYLQAMASITTLAMIDPTTALSSLSDPASVDRASYFLNGDAAHDVHRILLSAAEACIPQAAPSAFAWTLILGEIKRQAGAAKEARESGAVQRAIDQVATFDTATGRRTSSGSFQQSVYEEVITSIMNTSELADPATYLLRCTTEASNVFETINVLAKSREYRSSLVDAMSLQTLQELISIAVSSIGYAPEILSSQFAILANLNSDANFPDPRETFIKNDYLMDSIFAVALGRFPYESIPFLRMCRLLASAKVFDGNGTQYITFRLRAMDSFTQIATGSFSSYRTIREDENLNLVALEKPAPMLQDSNSRLLTYGRSNSEASIVAADALGEVISESTPPVVRWQHSYSGLALIGAWLELHYLGQLQSVLSPYELAEDVAAESIGIITSLLRSTLETVQPDRNESDRKQLQKEILDEASSILQGESNIADYIFEILEQELQAYRRSPSSTFNTTVLIACIDFATILPQIRRDAFWSSFSKSSLLESYGSDSFLMSIVAGVEVPNQSYAFLYACAKLYESVIKAIVRQAQVTTSRVVATKGHILQPQNLRLHANVLLSITQPLYAAFEAIPGWDFISKHQRGQIVASLATSFDKVVTFANVVQNSKAGLISSLMAASDFLVQQIRLAADDVSNSTPVIRHIFKAQESHHHTTPNAHTDSSDDALIALQNLSVALIKVGRLRTEPPSVLERQLFSAVPLLCRILARTLTKSTLYLIQDLLRAMAQSGPVSLLGHLGSISCISLIEVLKINLGDWVDNPTKIAIWELLGCLIGRNQQWLAIVILTGYPPEKSKKDEQDTTADGSRGKTFMEVALRQLIKIIELDQAVAVSILNFVIEAQTNWSWANEVMKADKDFLPAILSYVCNTYVDASGDIKIAYRNQIASLVTELSTIHLHHAKAKRDTAILKTILPLLQWLTENAIDVGSYNHSLHSNLRKNFASKFSGMQLSDFKRTGLRNAEYGESFYYDLDLADEVFKSEPHWNLREKLRDQSFKAEFCRANLNLSVVDSEVKLLRSLLNLCIEHSGYFAHDAEAQKVVIEIVKNCLDANAQAHPEANIFENVLQVRADVAISLLPRLVEVKAKSPQVRALLRHAWECARADNGSFEQAITDDNLEYWRTMLTIILMALQFQVDKRYMPPAADSSPAALLRHTEQAIPTILEIVTVVVGQGFRSVVAALQDKRQVKALPQEKSPTSISHKDVHIIITILETILRMTRLPEFISEASQRLVAEGTIQSCLLLYSWSHVLITPETNNEPVYASYCSRFLALLSSLPPVTEELAVEGVLSRLLSARITQKLQSFPEGVSHLDKRSHGLALYNLWATGMLPICLNLLHSVGAPVAAEVSIFLNQFPNQLNRASVAFIPTQSRPRSDTNLITTTVAEEATTLALISFILNSFRSAGASAAVDPSSIQLLAGYDEHKKALSEDISDVINSTLGSLKTRVIATSEKELVLSREGNGEGLASQIVSELRRAQTCLKSVEAEDDK